MRTLWQAALTAGLVILLVGCATEDYSTAHPGAYARNVFYCASYPSYGVDCPGGFYYNNVYFPDRYAFFRAYHIDRHHWHEFHGRRYWDRDDWEKHDGDGHERLHWNHGGDLQGPGVLYEREQAFPHAHREFPGGPSFDAGHGWHPVPHSFGWQR